MRSRSNRRLRQAAATVAATAIVLVGAGCDEPPAASEFIDDLRLEVRPKAAEAGTTIGFRVQGEPPLRLRAKKFVDLLTLERQPLYRLTAAAKGGSTDVQKYPLPSSYREPAGTARLQAWQEVRVPARLTRGRYILAGGMIVVRRQVTRGAPHTRITVAPSDP